MKYSSLLLVLALWLGAGSAHAQLGSDSCTTPDALAGQGSFPFDNTGASTGSQGQSETLCYAFGVSAVNNDVWFNWTADVTGTAMVSTCTAFFDTKIAAYPGGGCPATGTALDCNDDFCGLQSTINFPVVAGTSYMLQVGSLSVSSSGGGVWTWPSPVPWRTTTATPRR